MLNAYEKHEDLSTEERRMQMIYLLNDDTVEKKLSYEEIGKLVGYAWNTIRTYSYKFYYLLDEARKKFCSKVKKVIEGIVEKVPIIFGKGTKLCYLFKFYDSNSNLLFSKIGTTERTIMARIKEEIRSYQKRYDVLGVVIESVIDCGDIPPEGAESYARSEFIKRNPASYAKNDRFLGYDIPVEEFNSLVLGYLGA